MLDDEWRGVSQFGGGRAGLLTTMELGLAILTNPLLKYQHGSWIVKLHAHMNAEAHWLWQYKGAESNPFTGELCCAKRQ